MKQNQNHPDQAPAVRPRARDTSAATAARKAGHSRIPRVAAPTTGVVCADEAFTQEGFIVRLGITRTRFNEMRRRGLVVRRDGGRLLILGSDFLKYLETLPPAILNERQAGLNEPLADERQD